MQSSNDKAKCVEELRLLWASYRRMAVPLAVMRHVIGGLGILFLVRLFDADFIADSVAKGRLVTGTIVFALLATWIIWYWHVARRLSYRFILRRRQEGYEKAFQSLSHRCNLSRAALAQQAAETGVSDPVFLRLIDPSGGGGATVFTLIQRDFQSEYGGIWARFGATGLYVGCLVAIATMMAIGSPLAFLFGVIAGLVWWAAWILAATVVSRTKLGDYGKRLEAFMAKTGLESQEMFEMAVANGVEDRDILALIDTRLAEQMFPERPSILGKALAGVKDFFGTYMAALRGELPESSLESKRIPDDPLERERKRVVGLEMGDYFSRVWEALGRGEKPPWG